MSSSVNLVLLPQFFFSSYRCFFSRFLYLRYNIFYTIYDFNQLAVWRPLLAIGFGSSTSSILRWRARPRRRWNIHLIYLIYSKEVKSLFDIFDICSFSDLAWMFIGYWMKVFFHHGFFSSFSRDLPASIWVIAMCKTIIQKCSLRREEILFYGKRNVLPDSWRIFTCLASILKLRTLSECKSQPKYWFWPTEWYDSRPELGTRGPHQPIASLWQMQPQSLYKPLRLRGGVLSNWQCCDSCLDFTGISLQMEIYCDKYHSKVSFRLTLQKVKGHIEASYHELFLSNHPE